MPSPVTVWRVDVHVRELEYDHPFYVAADHVEVEEWPGGRLRLRIFPPSGTPIELTFANIRGIETHAL
jgi:hypothetical protein